MKSLVRALLMTPVLIAFLPVTAVPASTRTLAIVDGQALTSEDLEAMFSAQHMGHTSFLLGRTEVERALDRLIERTLLLHEADRMDIGNRPEIRAGFDDLVARRAVKHLVKLEIEDAAQPSEAQLRAAYDQYTAHLLKVRQIVVPEKSEAEEIAALLAEGASFAELAGERSRVKSRQADGLLPPIGWGTMEAAWDDVAFGLEEGEISAPFASGGAWEILLLEEKVKAERPSYEESVPKLSNILLRRALDERERALSADLFDRYEVQIKLQPFEVERYRAAVEEGLDTVVAVWNGGRLLLDDLAPRLNFHALQSLTPGQASRDIEEQVRISVTKPLLLLEARARDYPDLPEVRSAAETYRERSMLSVLHEEYIFKGLTVTDDDVRAWYDSHPDDVRTAEKRFVSQILVDSEAEARAARQRLDNGEPFADLARELSRDTASAPKGGALGWIAEKDSPAGFESVFSLGQGGISEPLQTDLGWHLIRVLEIEPARTLSYEDTESRIRDHLIEEKKKDLRREWLAQLREAAEIEVDAKAVSAFVDENARASR